MNGESTTAFPRLKERRGRMGEDFMERAALGRSRVEAKRSGAECDRRGEESAQKVNSAHQPLQRLDLRGFIVHDVAAPIKKSWLPSWEDVSERVG